jgi:hypothetical protein
LAEVGLREFSDFGIDQVRLIGKKIGKTFAFKSVKLLLDG